MLGRPKSSLLPSLTVIRKPCDKPQRSGQPQNSKNEEIAVLIYLCKHTFYLDGINSSIFFYQAESKSEKICEEQSLCAMKIVKLVLLD